MSTAGGLLLLAVVLLGPAKALLVGDEVPWGMAFEIGRIAPGPAGTVVAAAAGVALLALADRRARGAGGFAAPAGPWRPADLLAVCLLFAATNALGAALDVFLFERPGGAAEAPLARPLAVCDLAAAAAVAVAYLAAAATRRGASPRILLGPVASRLAAAGAAAAVGLGLLLLAAAGLAPEIAGVRLPPLGAPGGRRAALALLLGLEGLVVPALEEALFRPFLYGLLLRAAPAPAAVGAAGLLFGLLHGGGPALGPRAAGGIVMTWLYARSGSILPGLVVHAGFNLGLRLLPAWA